METGHLAAYDLRINSAGYFESYRDGIWRPPALFDDYDLLVITSGTATGLFNGKRHAITQNDVLLMRRGDRIEKPVAAGRLANTFVHFDFLGPDAKPMDPPERVLPPRRPASVDSHVIGHMTQAVLGALTSGEGASAKAILKAILLMLAGRPESATRDFSVEHRSRLFGEMASRILQDPGPRRKTQDLAHEVGMSPAHFRRVFRRVLGHTPCEFMVSARVERAKLLLATTSQPIREIASSLGYVDEYYFTRQFAEKTGTPPAMFRKKQTGRRSK